MKQYIPAKSKELVKELEKAGFERISRKGSHIKLKRGTQTITVPDSGSKDMCRMMARRFMKEAGIFL